MLFQSITHMAPAAAVAFSIIVGAPFAGGALPLGLPNAGAYVFGALIGLVVMLAIPYLLGWREQVVLLLISVGGLVVVFGFISQADNLGAGRALAIFGSIAVVVGLLAWVLNRYVAPLSDRRPPR